MIDQEFEDLKKRLPMLRSEPPLPGDFRLEGAGRAPADGPIDTGALRAAAISALKTVYDPEIPLNIYDLGLIYQLDVDETGAARVQMTLTAPGCPVAGALVHEVHENYARFPEYDAQRPSSSGTRRGLASE